MPGGLTAPERADIMGRGRGGANVMPWAAYEHIRRPGFRDLAWALASHECDGWAEK